MTPVVYRDPRSPRGEGKPLPLALAGLPARIEGKTCYYRRKEIARVGSFVHRGTGKVVTISKQRMQQWVAAFNKRLAKGLRPFVSDLHTERPRATDTFGYVVALSIEGDKLYADLQLIGDDALALAARNDISLYAVADALDADGEKYPECIHHCALTPDAAHPNLGGYMTIAASAGVAATSVPVYERSDPFALSAGQARQGATMPFTLSEELGRKLRDKLGLGADVPDEQVATLACEHTAAAIEVQGRADRDAAKVTALSTEKTRLERELAAANEKVLALSADAPKELDGRTLSLMRRQFKTDRQAVIDSGVISTAGMDKIDALLGINDANGVALSLSAGEGEDADMIYSRLCEIIAANPGVKTNNAINRSKLALSATRAADPDAPVSDERYRELMSLTGTGQAVLDSRK